LKKAISESVGQAASEDLAIRFVNTMAWRLRTPTEERLQSSWGLLDWLQANGIADAKQIRGISRIWKEKPAVVSDVYQFAISLREAIYELLVAHIRGSTPPEWELAVLNDALSTPAPLLRSASSGKRYVWQSRSTDGDIRDLLMPIALSAVELTTGLRATKVRQCQDDRGCGWLFVDESRAQNRRWCSMGDCGNRAKARRHYARARHFSP
jgi:predicted RNA-binding Zn ribbon-like protein